MPLLASEITLQAASQYLNDAGRTRWTDPVLLPYLKGAYDQLQLELVAIDAPAIDEITTAAIVLAANTAEMVAIEGLLYPIKLWERKQGGLEGDWSELLERDWDPSSPADSSLTRWIWREDAIKLLPSNQIREVKLLYKRALSAIADVNSQVPIVLAKTFLAAKTAELAARYGGSNPSRADKLLEDEVIPQLNKFTGIIIRKMQFQGVQRQPFMRTQI